MIALLCLCASFGAGFFLRGNVDLLTDLGFDTGLDSADTNPGMTVSGSTFDSLSARVAEVQGVLESYSINQYNLDTTTVATLDTIMQSTGDSYAEYLNQEQYETYLAAASSNYNGIGVLFSENDGKAYAVDVFSGSEAESKGVEPGDYVESINGEYRGSGWTQAEVVHMLDKAAGTTVMMQWRRPASLSSSGGEEFTVELTVSSYEEPNVEVELDEDTNIGYIRLSQVSSNSASLVQKAIENLEAQDAEGYVLDLRDNPGGFLTQAVDIGSLFVKSGTFVEIFTKDSTLTREVSGYTATEDPLVVLVNANTGGAAEVLAGGLQDNSRATIVGEITQGKGTVQSVRQLSFGGAIRYTSAYYKTPKGYEIKGVGINPDVQISDDSGISQKDYAMDLAQNLVEENS